jgi:hypothetical protein
MIHNLDKKNNRYVITTASATIFTLAIMITSIMATAPAAATTTAATTTSSEEQGIIQLSPEPVYREVHTPISRTPINETHFQVPISGNGTITLPNTTETISITSTGSYLSSLDGTAVGKEVITTEDGSESATAKIYGVAQLEERRGIIIGVFDTNSTGRLAPLDGMILAGQIEYPPEEDVTLITLWEWESGGPLPPTATTETTTNTSTNATGVGGQEEATIGAGEGQLSPEEEEQQAAEEEEAAINTTTAGPPEEEEVGGGEEQQQQQQTAPTIPPAPNPLFE